MEFNRGSRVETVSSRRASRTGRLREHGDRLKESIIDGAVDRLRPVLLFVLPALYHLLHRVHDVVEPTPGRVSAPAHP